MLCALLFYAHVDYQSVVFDNQRERCNLYFVICIFVFVVGEANHFSQEAMSSYIIEEVTAALNHPTVVNMFIKFPSTRQERDIIKQRKTKLK